MMPSLVQNAKEMGQQKFYDLLRWPLFIQLSKQRLLIDSFLQGSSKIFFSAAAWAEFKNDVATDFMLATYIKRCRNAQKARKKVKRRKSCLSPACAQNNSMKIRHPSSCKSPKTFST